MDFIPTGKTKDMISRYSCTEANVYIFLNFPFFSKFHIMLLSLSQAPVFRTFQKLVQNLSNIFNTSFKYLGVHQRLFEYTNFAAPKLPRRPGRSPLQYHCKQMKFRFHSYVLGVVFLFCLFRLCVCVVSLLCSPQFIS